MGRRATRATSKSPLRPKKPEKKTTIQKRIAIHLVDGGVLGVQYNKISKLNLTQTEEEINGQGDPPYPLTEPLHGQECVREQWLEHWERDSGQTMYKKHWKQKPARTRPKKKVNESTKTPKG
jgi:hypothetical protein